VGRADRLVPGKLPQKTGVLLCGSGSETSSCGSTVEFFVLALLLVMW